MQRLPHKGRLFAPRLGGKRLLGSKLPRLLSRNLERVLLLPELNQLYAQVAGAAPDLPFVDRVLQQLDLQYELANRDLLQIPRTGPAVVVANHPLGMVDGIILASILGAVRPDFKILANLALRRVSELCDRLIFVNPFGGANSVRSNTRPVKEAIRWLKSGGVLGIFPAGEVAHINLRQRAITDPQWNSSVARIIRNTGVPVLPLLIEGSNSLMFQLCGLINPKVRTALLPRELLNKRSRRVIVRIGSLIPIERLESFESNREMINYLRHRTYLLSHRTEPTKQEELSPVSTPKSNGTPIIGPISPAILVNEIGALPAEQELVTSPPYSVFYANAYQIPCVLREIGRLREIAFRNAKEGTGNAVDIDEYDSHYIHLFLWNRDINEVVGAYRIGNADEIVARFGKRGLYSYSLFKYGLEFLDRINPSLELGRSFIRVEYQKAFPPLFLLWKGIARYVLRHPQYKTLFGPVTIGNDYSPIARRFIVECLTGAQYKHELAHLVGPRTPFRGGKASQRVVRHCSPFLNNIDEVGSLISDIQTDRRGIPVLLKQYLKLGGKLLGFNVDHNFSDALDGLILVDLTKVDARMLNRLMGQQSTEKFLQSHTTGYLLAS